MIEYVSVMEVVVEGVDVVDDVVDDVDVDVGVGVGFGFTPTQYE